MTKFGRNAISFALVALPLLVPSLSMAVENGGRGGGNPEEAEFAAVARAVENDLNSSPSQIRVILGGDTIDRFVSAVESTFPTCASGAQLDLLKKKNKVAWFEPADNAIYLDCARWPSIKSAGLSTKLLVAHEYFRKAGLEGSEYGLSSKLNQILKAVPNGNSIQVGSSVLSDGTIQLGSSIAEVSVDPANQTVSFRWATLTDINTTPELVRYYTDPSAYISNSALSPVEDMGADGNIANNDYAYAPANVDHYQCVAKDGKCYYLNGSAMDPKISVTPLSNGSVIFTNGHEFDDAREEGGKSKSGCVFFCTSKYHPVTFSAVDMAYVNARFALVMKSALAQTIAVGGAILSDLDSYKDDLQKTCDLTLTLSVGNRTSAPIATINGSGIEGSCAQYQLNPYLDALNRGIDSKEWSELLAIFSGAGKDCSHEDWLTPVKSYRLFDKSCTEYELKDAKSAVAAIVNQLKSINP